MKLFGMPAAPLALTLAGVLPFAAGAGVMLAAADQPILKAQAGLVLLVYGAVILSFLGGLRWGAEIAARDEAPRAGILGLSVLGSLAGWGLVLWMFFSGAGWPMFAAAAGLHLVHGLWDAGAGGLPGWMRRVRVIGAACAAASLGAGAAAYFV
jgi:Protein of unknown function (DUF3429)